MENAIDARNGGQQGQPKEILDAYARLYGVIYDKAANYTNLVVALGYAGFFGLWSITESYLGKYQALWAAMLMLTSIAIFVFFEVYKAMVVTRAAQRRVNTYFEVESSENLESILLRIQSAEAAIAKAELRVSQVWPWAFGAAVVFGGAAIVVLLASFVSCLVLR